MNRQIYQSVLVSDYIVVGGGLAGVCSAITAARQGIKVVLIQDRPVLGGNASSEVRVWALGAAAHMNTNNRWSREGGVIDEILVENLHTNPEGNPYFFDDLLLDKVLAEPLITLLLNTAVNKVQCDEVTGKINQITAFNSSNETEYLVKGQLFCDASGDGIVGYLSGADFTDQAETKETFGESLVQPNEFGHRLGSSLMFSIQDMDHEVPYTPPSYIFDDIKKIKKYKQIKLLDEGCHFWWMEFGGRLDTIHDNENIKYELRSALYTTWNYIKNSGKFPEAKNKTISWVGSIPGKRESRRFLGDYVLTQEDVLQNRQHEDAVSYGGWSIDLHPADGMYSEFSSSFHRYSKTIYTIPYRSLYSRNVPNLFISGRLISSSHIAFGSTRVMLTAAMNGQAVGIAAAMCTLRNLNPRDLYTNNLIEELQNKISLTGQYIPTKKVMNYENMVSGATITAKEHLFNGLKHNGSFTSLDKSFGVLLPVEEGKLPSISFITKAVESTHVGIRVYQVEGFTPSQILYDQQERICSGTSRISIHTGIELTHAQYLLIEIVENSAVQIGTSSEHYPGIVTLYRANDDVHQTVCDSQDVDFQGWNCPRYPYENLSFTLDKTLSIYPVSNVSQAPFRPTHSTNSWVVDCTKPSPQVRLSHPQFEEGNDLVLTLYHDTDTNQAIETLKKHRFQHFPNCIRDYRILDSNGNLLHEVKNNFQSINKIELFGVCSESLLIFIDKTWGSPFAGIYGIHIEVIN